MVIKGERNALLGIAGAVNNFLFRPSWLSINDTKEGLQHAYDFWQVIKLKHAQRQAEKKKQVKP